MRVLILSAILACASAAPSAPIVTPGDIQGAAIDAKVKAEDTARAATDQARLAADIARDRAELVAETKKIEDEQLTSKTMQKRVALSGELHWDVDTQKWKTVEAIKAAQDKLSAEFAPLKLPYTNVVYANLLPFLPSVEDQKLVKTTERNNIELPKFNGLAPISLGHPSGLSIIAAPWAQGRFALYQPGLFGAGLPFQPVLTTVL